MKRLFLFVMAIVFVFHLSAQTIISVGDTNSSQQTPYAPVSYAYYNSYSQTIYPASELISGGIFAISYYCSALNATPEGTIKIYMAEVENTTLSNFLSGNNFVEVFSGPLQWVVGWNRIMLDTPFVYTGTGNLLVAVIRDGNNWSASNQYKATSVTNSVVYHYGDYTEYDVNSSYSGYTSAFRPVIKLEVSGLDNYCYPITNLTIDTESLTENSATVSWEVLDESSTTFALAYKTDQASSEWITLSNNITDFSYELTGLNPYTRYKVKVWTVCESANSIEESVEFVTLPTDDLIISIPYSQNFEDLESVSEWYFSNNGVNQWHIGSAVDNTTTQTIGNSLYISNDNGLTNNYTNNSISVSHAYSLIEIEEGNYYGISLDVKLQGENTAYETDYFTLSLLPLAEELSTSMPNSNRIIERVLTTYNQWERINIAFPQDLEPTIYQLVLSWRNNDANGESPAVAVDNIEIISTPCARVNQFSVTMQDAQGSVNMNLAITDTLNENALYLVEYRYSGDTTWYSIQGANPVEITDLPYSSRVDYRVRSNCSGDFGVISEVFTAWTLCNSIADFPYVENFDTNLFVPIQEQTKENRTSLNCWYNVEGGSPYFYWSSITSNDGVNSTSALYFSGTTSSYSYEFSDWFISPIFELTGNERLNFEYKTTFLENPPIIEVYAMNVSQTDYTTMADTSNFTLIGTINTQSSAINQYNMAEILLNNYNNNTRLALVVREKSASFYIDNFTISELPACPEIYGFSVSKGMQSVNINYNNSNITSEGVVVAYAPATEGEFNSLLATTITIPSDAELPYTINGLTQGVTYNFAAQQACGGNWTNVVSVEIPNAYLVPINFDFNTPQTTPEMSFSSDSPTNAWFIGTAANNSLNESGDLTSAGALYISNDNGLTAAYTNTAAITNAADASLLLYLNPSQELTLSFDLKIGGEYYYDYLNVFLVPYGQEIDNSYLLEGFLCQIPIWQTKNITLPSGYSGFYSLVFRWVNNYMDGAQPAAVIDNIRIIEQSCSLSTIDWAVSSMENENGDMTLVVNLTDTGNETATYSLAYRATSQTSYTTLSDLTISDFPYVISEGISHQSTYNFQLSLLCTEEDSLFVGEYDITTPCQAIALPWNEDFSNPPYNTNCWQRYLEPSPSNGVISTDNLTPSNSSFCWGYASIFACGATTSAMIRTEIYHGSNNWVVTPVVNLGDSTIKQISFELGLRNYYVNSAPSVLEGGKVMILTSIDNGATWNKANAMVFADNDSDLVHNYSDLTNQMQRYSYKLVNENNEPLTGNVRFAFYSESPATFNYHWLCLDNISVEEWAECSAPYGVLVSEISSNTASISFQAEEDATLWEYVIVAGSEDEVNLDTLAPIQISTTQIALTGLAPLTEYTIGIRTICGENSSPWTIATFVSLAGMETLPYSTSFDDLEDAATWSFTQNLNPNHWAIGSATATEEGGSSAYISTDNGATYSASLAPATTLAYMWKDFDFGTTDNSFELSFDWKIRGRATGVYCGIILYLTELVEPPTNALPADSDAITLVYGSDEWENETIFLGNITGNKRLVILSFGYSNEEELIVPAAIDNLAINIVTCTPPTSAILVSSLTTNSATIEWQDEAHSLWNVYYKTSLETAYNLISVTNPTITLTELTPDSEYSLYITAMCDTEESSPSQEITFRTGCAPLEAEFDYDFETFLSSACWTKTTGLLSSLVTHTGTSYWNPSTNNVDGNSTMKLVNNIYGANKKDWLITPQIDLGESGALYQVSIDVALTKHGYQSISPYYSLDDKFAIVVSEDGGLTWSNANALIFANGDADSYHNYSDFNQNFTRVTFALQDENGIPLTGLIKIGFYTESTVDDGADNDLYIDNLSIELEAGESEDEPCNSPTGLSVINITATSAEILWNAEADAYEFKLNSGEAETLTTTNKLLTNLTPNTAYTVEVRAVCSEQTSEWVARNFTTLQAEQENAIVTTLPATNITNSSAELNAEVIAGNEEITVQGFIYKAISSQEWITLNSTIGEQMSETIEGLEAEMAYEFKAFASTESQTIYGDVISFTTLSGLGEVLANTLQINLYPNPTNTQTTLQINGLNQEAKIVICDLQGRILSQDKIKANTKFYTIKLSQIPSGVYYVRILTEYEVYTKKLIVE